MADMEEKVIPEAVEEKEETAAPAEEAKAEEAVPAEDKKEKKAKKEKKEKEPKAKKKNGGAVAAIIIAVVLLLAAGGAALFFFLCGNQAVTAYKAKKYEEAYEKSQLAFFLNAADKECINYAYAAEVLYPEGNYYKAASITANITMEEAKTRLAKKCPLLGICTKGAIANFGKYETDAMPENGQEDLEWIVLDIKDDGQGGKYAILLTKDIIASPSGWNRGAASNTKYSASNLNEWCNTFYNELTMTNAALGEKILKVKVDTGSDSVAAKVYAPSKEELEQYLTGDLAQYLNAVATTAAEGTVAGGNTTTGSEEEEGAVGEEVEKLITSYYVRNASDKGIGGYTEGKYVDNLSATEKSIGARVIVNVALGTAK